MAVQHTDKDLPPQGLSEGPEAGVGGVGDLAPPSSSSCTRKAKGGTHLSALPPTDPKLGAAVVRLRRVDVSASSSRASTPASLDRYGATPGSSLCESLSRAEAVRAGGVGLARSESGVTLASSIPISSDDDDVDLEGRPGSARLPARAPAGPPRGRGSSRSSARRKRGLPSSSEECAGPARAGGDVAAAARELRRLEGEAEVLHSFKRLRLREAQVLPAGGRVVDAPVGDVRDAVLAAADLVDRVATRSRNLKSTFQGALHRAAETVRNAAGELEHRVLVAQDREALAAANERLRERIALLEREVREMRGQLVVLAQQSAPAVSDDRRGAGSRRVTRSTTAASRPVEPPGGRTRRGGRGRTTPAVGREAIHSLDDLFMRVQGMVARELSSFRGELLGRETAAAAASRRPARRSYAAAVRGGRRGGGAPPAPARAAAAPVPSAAGRASGGGRAPSGRGGAGNAGKKGVSLPWPTPRREGKRTAVRLRVPGRAVVALTAPPGGSLSAAMSRARREIPLESLGLGPEGFRVRPALSGGLLLEVPGPDSSGRADKLADLFRQAFPKEELRVGRPVKRAELRVAGLLAPVTEGEVVDAVASAAACPREDVQPGVLRMPPSGAGGTLWLRCPAAAAKRLATVGGGRIRVGWASAAVAILPARPTQCFRCLRLGHVASRCPVKEAPTSPACYRCGERGHLARGCTAGSPQCPLCAELGVPAGHRMGGRSCRPPPQRARRRGVRTGAGSERSPAVCATPSSAEVDPGLPGVSSRRGASSAPAELMDVEEGRSPPGVPGSREPPPPTVDTTTCPPPPPPAGEQRSRERARAKHSALLRGLLGDGGSASPRPTPGGSKS